MVGEKFVSLKELYEFDFDTLVVEEPKKGPSKGVKVLWNGIALISPSREVIRSFLSCLPKKHTVRLRIFHLKISR